MVENELGAGGVLHQGGAGVRFDWGEMGAEQLSTGAGCLVVVDVLSFTTAVTVATGRGIAVLPYRFGDPSAEAFATAQHARLAVRRRDVSAEHPWSLSPPTLAAAPLTPRLVLPSPNGSAISAAAKGVVVAACLRNAAATAQWLCRHGYGTSEHPAVAIAAGERWRDGSLRPALEDALGAGAVLHHLDAVGCELSVEAKAVAALYEATDAAAAVRSCVSGLELARAGYAGDVDAAIEVDCDAHVPVLSEGAFSAT